VSFLLFCSFEEIQCDIAEGVMYAEGKNKVRRSGELRFGLESMATSFRCRRRRRRRRRFFKFFFFF